MKAILSGINYFLDGFSLLTKPGIKRFVMIPLIVNIVIFIGLFILLNHYVAMFNHWVAQHVPHWLAWFANILWVLFFLSFVLIFVNTFVTLSNLIAAPFNSLLSEKIERLLTGKSLASRDLWENIKDVPRIVGRQLLVLGYYLPRVILLLILFFIPILQLIAPVLWFLFHAWFMTMTFIDYPTDNHRLSFKRMQQWMRDNRWLSLSLGSCIVVAIMIPVINFFAVPAAVIAATKMWVENKHNE